MKKPVLIILIVSSILLVFCTLVVVILLLIFKPFSNDPNGNDTQDLSISPSLISPTTFPESRFKITNGDLYISNDNGINYEIAVDASRLGEEAEIASYEISPTNTDVCFLVQEFGPEWLYYAKIENQILTGVQQVALGENCVWNHEGTKIAFTNSTSDVSPHNVYLFNVATKISNQLTFFKYDDEYLRIYKEPSWSMDDKYIFSNYIDYSFNNDGTIQIASQGKSTIDLVKGKVTDSED